MLRLAALGLFQTEPLNGYRLKQQLEIFMGCCLCVNYGAIYPLLKRMEEQGEIVLCAEEAAVTGQSRKVYNITPLGCDRWKQEMMSSPQESWVNSRSRFVIKFFFFSHLQPAERVQLLEHRLMTCRLRLAKKQAEFVSDDRYQMLVKERSIAMIQSEIQWLTEQLANEQASTHSPIPPLQFN
ncbi:PadR family transcriptional regulator [Kovacikia minuta CCNUW1]|uniref:PadR family transcriptional regulator n=1 Tax=Kovacikia minuta TaxID=2931930 RepID=UPI001CCCC7A7|nr:PadR family transcriptional regulator [Kovacikia minuta]UBF27002.1 PadR family transcriptional regulator [Kovacikia minuta CCNUW1]